MGLGAEDCASSWISVGGEKEKEGGMQGVGESLRPNKR